MSTDGLLSLLETHEHLDDLFALHQEAVIMLNFSMARELLQAYRMLLDVHVQQEEHLLMPLFERCAPLERAPAVLFTGQHRKMHAMLDRISTQLGQLLNPPGTRRQAIALLDLETAFKHLVEHHNGAEEAYFYPALHRGATAEESIELLQRCRQEWATARRSVEALVAYAQGAVAAPPRHD